MHIKPIKTQQINGNVYVIRTIISNFYIYTDGESTLCFDSGYLPLVIRQALKKINIAPEAITHIFLTHSDYDHVGGIKVFPKARIFLSSEEEQMITFKKPRLLLMFNKGIKRNYELLGDGETVNVGKIKVQAISTPGHTLGSMSYLVNDRILFSGDTLTVQKGKIKPFFFLQNMNTPMLKASMQKVLKDKTIEMICTGHSGYMEME